jgi:plastocyanin
VRRAGLVIVAALALLVGAVPARSGDEQRQPPVASLSVAPQEVVAGEPVVLDGSRSRDPDGSVASYAFDLDGDGAFERVTGGEPRLAHAFEEAGQRSVGLRVVDDSGESADANASLTVTAPPEPEPEPAAEPEPRRSAEGPPERAGTSKRVRSASESQADAAERRPRARTREESDRVRAAASTTVSIRDFSFAPRSVTVNVGDTVTWRNTGDEPHTATGSGFDTGTLRSGQSGSHTFNSAGTFSYKCTPHPFMTASVTVRGSGSGSGGSGGSDGDGANATQDADGSGGTSSSSSGDSLPSTGLALASVVLTGLAMIGAGLLLRRRAAWPGT